jgi:transposase
VVFCDLLIDGPGQSPGCGLVGSIATPSSAASPTSRWPGIRSSCGSVSRYRCVHDGCARKVFAHDSSRLARPGASTTRRCADFVLRRLAVEKATVSAVARELGRGWDTLNQHRRRRHPGAAADRRPGASGRPRGDRGRRAQVVPRAGRRRRRVRHRDHDVPPVVAGHGPARLLDMAPGRLRRPWSAAGRPVSRASATRSRSYDGWVRRPQERRHRGAPRQVLQVNVRDARLGTT